MRTNSRVATRKALGPIHFHNLTSLEKFAILARVGVIVDASSRGFLLRVTRRDLVPKNLRGNLNIDCLVGEKVMLKIEEMNLEVDGKVARTSMIGRGVFEIAIDFSASAPDYWRECLLDLLPNKDEFTDD